MVRAIDAEKGDISAERARREMADEQEKRRARLQRDVAQLEKDQKRAEEQVGVEPVDLRAVVETALGRDGVVLAPATIAGVADAFTIDPSRPAFEKDASWADLFDELREGRTPKRRKLTEWRASTPVRAIAFEAPVLPDGRDADGVVHLHLEHRLVRRLISRFVPHGFKAGLKLAEDRALHPDTMDERVGGWGRLLALFRLVHGGHASGWIAARKGKLFDPQAFPFLEGRDPGSRLEDAQVLPIRDGAILRILEGLMTIEAKPVSGERVRERLSYRSLDVEQIGSVYETVMGFKVLRAPGPMLCVKGEKRLPVFVDIATLAAKAGKERRKLLKAQGIAPQQ
jgi:hypothetical protein